MSNQLAIAVKGGQHLFQGQPHGGPWEIVRFIKEQANQFPVETMCKVLMVSVSGYYYWLKHPVGARQLKSQQTQIQQVYNTTQSRYGSPRLARDLNESGVKASRNRVARLMHKANIRSIMYKKYRVQTTESKHDYPVANNLLNREFSAEKPGQKWVSDLYPNRRRVVIPNCYCRFSGQKGGWLGLERSAESSGYQHRGLANGP